MFTNVVNLKLDDRQRASLEQMALTLDTSMTGVIRKSLALMSLVIDERAKGNEIAITKDDKIIKAIVGIFELNK